jgi:hypothetical protein
MDSIVFNIFVFLNYFLLNYKITKIYTRKFEYKLDVETFVWKRNILIESKFK